MDVWILESAQAVAEKAADICAALIQERPDARLGLGARLPGRFHRHRAGLLESLMRADLSIRQSVAVTPRLAS